MPHQPWHHMGLSPFPGFSKTAYKNAQKPNPSKTKAGSIGQKKEGKSFRAATETENKGVGPAWLGVNSTFAAGAGGCARTHGSPTALPPWERFQPAAETPPSSENPPPLQQLHSNSTTAPPTPPTWPLPRPFLGTWCPSTRSPSKGQGEGQNTPAGPICAPQGWLQGKREDPFGHWKLGSTAPRTPRAASLLYIPHSCGAEGQPTPCTPQRAAGGGCSPTPPGRALSRPALPPTCGVTLSESLHLPAPGLFGLPAWDLPEPRRCSG